VKEITSAKAQSVKGEKEKSPAMKRDLQSNTGVRPVNSCKGSSLEIPGFEKDI